MIRPRRLTQKRHRRREFALKYYGDWGIPHDQHAADIPWASNQVAMP